MTVYYKMRQILSQNTAAILLQNQIEIRVRYFITKCYSYCKMQRLLQIETVH